MKKYSLPVKGIILLITFMISLVCFSQTGVDPIVSSIQKKLNGQNPTVLQELHQLMTEF